MGSLQRAKKTITQAFKPVVTTNNKGFLQRKPGEVSNNPILATKNTATANPAVLAGTKTTDNQVMQGKIGAMPRTRVAKRGALFGYGFK